MAINLENSPAISGLVWVQEAWISICRIYGYSPEEVDRPLDRTD